MDVERSSLCNCVVNFLLEENYVLTAFELLHELLDDGRDDQAIRLKEFFSNPSHFPPDQISRFNSLRVADPQSLLEEKEALEEKLAISEYELRLAQEDISKIKTKLQKKNEFLKTDLNGADVDVSVNHGPEFLRQKRDAPLSDLGPLKDNERQDLNCAVKEYLLIAGYRLTAMTFYEEVADQNLDIWQNTPACVPDALRHYYYQYLSSTTEAAEEKVAMIREKDSLKKENERLNHEKACLLKNKDLADGQISALTKALEAVQKDLKDKENLVQNLKQSLEHQRKDLNDCRAEITALKMQIEGFRSGRNLSATDVDHTQSLERYKEQIKSLQMEIESLKSRNSNAPDSVVSISSDRETTYASEKIVEIHEDKNVIPNPADAAPRVADGEDAQSQITQNSEDCKDKSAELSLGLLENPSSENSSSENSESVSKLNSEQMSDDSSLLPKSDNLNSEAASEKMASSLFSMRH
ncbi:LIS1 motif containing protein [Trema orientale]|uniref:LIS1 motif containing protein n=1 Tax=Trema orientale TaxID=63057 RepID=A0A2P5BKB0_TREOI|nr:LIS1 motif containing protein [Trema orientale]